MECFHNSQLYLKIDFFFEIKLKKYILKIKQIFYIKLQTIFSKYLSLNFSLNLKPFVSYFPFLHF